MILGTKKKYSGIINDIIKPWWGAGNVLLFHSNNHMDPDGSENLIQSLLFCQDVSVLNNDWENIVGAVL